MTILADIIENKRRELVISKGQVSPKVLSENGRNAPAPRGFAEKLSISEAPVVIAELKRRSPSRGLIRENFDPWSCARAYANGGAAALSVLTDRHFFGGSLEDLAVARTAVSLPILRKDFIIDTYQIDEARVNGADAVLLIVAALDAQLLRELHEYAKTCALDVLVEVHCREELDIAASVGATLIGINNRDLRSFETDLSITETLAPEVSHDVLVVAESGISSSVDIERLTRAGAGAFLVGESLMRQPDPSEALRDLRGKL